MDMPDNKLAQLKCLNVRLLISVNMGKSTTESASAIKKVQMIDSRGLTVEGTDFWLV